MLQDCCQKDEAEELQKLFGFQPIDVVPAEYCVTLVWDALDETVEHKRDGVRLRPLQMKDDSVDLLKLRKGAPRAVLVVMSEGMHSPQSSATPPLGWNGAMQVEDVPWNTNGYCHLAQDQRLKSHLEVFRRKKQIAVVYAYHS